MDDVDANRERIGTRIAEIIGANWQTSQRATLLSAIGSIVRKEFPNSEFLRNGLRAFLTSWPVVQVVLHPAIKEKVGAVPLGVQVPADASRLFEPPTPRRHPVFVREFWRAFYEPLHTRRFVVLGTPEPIVQVIDGSEPPPDMAAYEILQSDLAVAEPGAPVAEKARLVGDRIRAWLSRHELSEAQFIERSASSTKREARGSVSTDDLAEALKALEPADQARIFVPLDLVQKMLSAKS
ncbi:hypothetical protein H8A99_15355 [Bradyrhizobium sp. Arg68]|uniref:hypothetical protein n=1 Tax=Bradyrhizobium ivorense TaxID=2511166 RepID=UPI001E2DCFE3|nr:hypothetical protein [Bradyrhizobium ivorense]MCC8937811.1 hypothetical protein [Bradyrhizobium ivorense]